MAIADGDLDEEGDIVKKERAPATPEPAVKEAVQKDEGLIVFFPGIPFFSVCILSHVFGLYVLFSFLWLCLILTLLMVLVFIF